MTARLLLDEMFSPRIATELVERGYDCRSVAADPLLRERPDDALFAVAAAEQRILVTENVVDFERLRRDRVADTAHVPPLISTSAGLSKRSTGRSRPTRSRDTAGCSGCPPRREERR